eukprot:5407423-Amphidinium_carterae.1
MRVYREQQKRRERSMNQIRSERSQTDDPSRPKPLHVARYWRRTDKSTTYKWGVAECELTQSEKRKNDDHSLARRGLDTKVRRSQIRATEMGGLLSTERERALADVRRDGLSLRDAQARYKADREIVLAAVKQNWGALAYAAEECQADSEIVLEAVKKNGRALQ